MCVEMSECEHEHTRTETEVSSDSQGHTWIRTEVYCEDCGEFLGASMSMITPDEERE